MVRIVLIRHSKTKGNLEGRYIGITDEHLCEEGIRLIKEKTFPKVEKVYSSPLLRCLETSKLIYPQLNPAVYENLKECNFGLFENKNYKELNGDVYYQKWIDSEGKIPFPQGESNEEFRNRCVHAFNNIVEDIFMSGIKTSAIICHGGTIMSILHEYSYPHKDFYNWQIKNCEGFILEIDKNLWGKGDKKITVVRALC